MMTVAEAELVRRAQEKGRSASFCAPTQLAAAQGALSKAHSSLDLQQMDATAAAACLSAAAHHTPGTPQRLLKVAHCAAASKRSQSCRVTGSARPPRVKRRESSTKDLNVGINAIADDADISTVAAAYFADSGDQSLPYNPFLRKVPSCGRLVTLTAADGAGTGSGEELAEDSPILRRSASARRPRPFESPQHSPTPTRVTRASQKGRGTVKKAPGGRNRAGGAAAGGSGYLDVKPSCSSEVLDPDAYLLRNFSTSTKGLVNRGDSFRRRRSRSNSIQPPLDQQVLPPQPCTSQPQTPPVTTPTGSTAATPQQILTPGAGSPEALRSFRVAIIGAQGVGKTALITQFQSSECINAYDINPTDETEYTVSILLNNLESEMVFVNVATATEFQRETQRAEGPEAWLVLYSITDKASFNRANEDLIKLQSFGLLRGTALILVANKCELVRSRAVSVDDGRELACSYGGKFMEISVGMNHRCDELLVGILNQCRIKEEQDDEEEEPREKEKTWTRNRSLMRASMKAKRVINKIMGKTETKYKNCEDFDT